MRDVGTADAKAYLAGMWHPAWSTRIFGYISEQTPRKGNPKRHDFLTSNLPDPSPYSLAILLELRRLLCRLPRTAYLTC